MSVNNGKPMFVYEYKHITFEELISSAIVITGTGRKVQLICTISI